MQKNIAIFASGSGTNAENIICYFQGNKTIRVSLVVSNKPDAFVLQRAERLGIPTCILAREQFARGGEVVELLRGRGIDFIVLAGFLLRVPDELLQAYPQRIVTSIPPCCRSMEARGCTATGYTRRWLLRASAKAASLYII